MARGEGWRPAGGAGQDQVAWTGLRVGTQKHRVSPVRLVAFGLSPESAGRPRAGLREESSRGAAV